MAPVLKCPRASFLHGFIFACTHIIFEHERGSWLRCTTLRDLVVASVSRLGRCFIRLARSPGFSALALKLNYCFGSEWAMRSCAPRFSCSDAGRDVLSLGVCDWDRALAEDFLLLSVCLKPTVDRIMDAIMLRSHLIFDFGDLNLPPAPSSSEPWGFHENRMCEFS